MTHKAPLAEFEEIIFKCPKIKSPEQTNINIDQRQPAQNRTNKFVHYNDQVCYIKTDFPDMRQISYLRKNSETSFLFSPIEGTAIQNGSNHSPSTIETTKEEKVKKSNGCNIRKIKLKRSADNKFGFCFVGGVDTNFDIFVSSIIPDGVADLNGEMKPGDKIIKVNNQSFENVKHHQALEIIKNATSPTVFHVKYEPKEFESLKQLTSPCSLSSSNSVEYDKKLIYLKAEFSFNADLDQRIPGKGLSFQTGDIMLVFNMGDVDWWQAVKVSPTSTDVVSQSGFIPSKKRVEKNSINKARKVNFDISTETSKENHEKSFKKKFICSIKSKKSKAVTIENSSQLSPTSFPSYQVVELKKFNYSRPVFLMGAEYAKIADDLSKEDGGKYIFCVSCTSREQKENELNGHSYYFKTKQNMLEMLREGHFVEIGVFNNELYGTTIQEINSYGHKPGVHCLLNINPASLGRLISLGVDPIVIFVRLISIENTSSIYKNCKRPEHIQIFDTIRKIEETNSKLFTVMVDGCSYMEIYEKVKSAIDSFDDANYGWVMAENKL